MARILKGKIVSENIDTLTKELISKQQKAPLLTTVRVGENGDDISYEKSIIKKADLLNIPIDNIVLDSNISYDDFYRKLSELNNDPNRKGILIFRPVKESLNNQKVRNFIDTKKDIDGASDLSLMGVFTSQNIGYTSCTAQAVIELLKYYQIEISGKNVVILGRSLLIGKPLAMLFLDENASVTILHSKSKNIKEITSNADIVVSSMGKANYLDKSYFSPHQTVVDLGVSYDSINNKLSGDVLFEEVEPIVENITPMIGGVGAITTAILFNHLLHASNK